MKPLLHHNSTHPELKRRLPVGAEIVPGGVHFRVWAPERNLVEVVIENGMDDESSAPVLLVSEQNGYFSGFKLNGGNGMLYRYRLDGGALYPDPASRFQPEGPHGPSQVVDPDIFRWTDDSWRGVVLEGQVIYEMHIGTFTPEGTWEAAAARFESLAETGITLLEVMPVADFAGSFGWGYDGVDLFAPTRLYGTPDQFRSFVDRAHSFGLGVILDVVYNHFGPDGDYTRQFSKSYFTEKYDNEWGAAINFDGENSGPVREFIISNAGYWIEEFHLDGLRLDATQTIFDSSPEHILSAVTKKGAGSFTGQRHSRSSRERAAAYQGDTAQ